MSYSKNFLSVLLLILSTVACAMHNQNDAKDKPQIPLRPLFPSSSSFSSPSSSSSHTASSDMGDQVEDDGKPVLTKAQIEEMAYVLTQADKKAQMIVEHLKDPTFLEDDEYRSAIFVGEPGTGKTTTALAIGHQMMVESGWQYKMLDSGAFLGKFRNQTAIKLKQFLRGIVALRAPMILIIDELNRLLEHANSEHHDTDTASTALWTFLDKQRGNQQFFFIGTMNDITKLPKPYKDRILFEFIQFKLISAPFQQAQALRYYLTQGKAQINPTLTDERLSALLVTIGSCSGRILKKMSGFIKRLYREHQEQPGGPIVVTEALVNKAIAEFGTCKEQIKYDCKDETDAERQDRYHTDTMARQEKHFLQQQLKQDLLAEYSFTDHHNYTTSSGGVATDYTNQVLKPEGVRRIQELFSSDQQEIMTELQAQTNRRVIREDWERVQREMAKIAAELAAAQERRRNGLMGSLGSAIFGDRDAFSGRNNNAQ